ncbi:Glycosyl transferase family 2 [Singulisphaera sp. GP187]|uniref:glycosyltransferase family 2 protein n=1 Tax=Singulisphaera sp. GP187 TaxID=1882752 RepID=UPI000929701A|nr:glycosyltransferase [Singulisphaera sp. GP187]SIO62087.1 Glycosyl transferase family 2 [Singulisphaera sp. GP187]
MDESPKITVAIPTYQGSRHLAEALRGILLQDGVTFDLLLSDDQSNDDTLQIARSLAGDRIRIQTNSERLGLAGNWNRCVALSRTPLVAIFHQDDRMEPGHLAAHVRAFDANPGAGLVSNEALVIDDQGQAVPETIVERSRIAPLDRAFEPGTFLSNLTVRNPLRCSAVTLRKKAHEELGGFDPSFHYVVDWDFWLRVANDWAVIWLARPTVAMRWHSASETHRFKVGTEDLEEIERLQARLFERIEPWANRVPLKQAADRRLARAYLNRAHDSLGQGDPTAARVCLSRAVALDRGILRTIAFDPRLALSLAALVTAPELTRRWYLRHRSTTTKKDRSIPQPH